MTDFSKLSRRERQIMEGLYARGEATVLQIQKDLPTAPTVMAIRRMLQILEEKGHLKRRKEGREFVYAPRQGKKSVGNKALKNVLATFFDGSVEQALATHFAKPDHTYTDDDLKRMIALIEEARKTKD